MTKINFTVFKTIVWRYFGPNIQIWCKKERQRPAQVAWSLIKQIIRRKRVSTLTARTTQWEQKGKKTNKKMLEATSAGHVFTFPVLQGRRSFEVATSGTCLTGLLEAGILFFDLIFQPNLAIFIIRCNRKNNKKRQQMHNHVCALHRKKCFLNEKAVLIQENLPI